MTKDELADFLEKWVSDVQKELADEFEVENFDDIYDVDQDEYMYESGYANGILYACKQIREKLSA